MTLRKAFMIDPSMQSCKVGAEYRDAHHKIGSGVYEELPLFALRKIYTSEEEQSFLKEARVGRPGPSCVSASTSRSSLHGTLRPR